MAGKVLSIEIGAYETRVLEIDYKTKKVPKIHHFFQIPTPDDMVADGSVMIDQAFIATMKRAFLENNIRTNRVIFVLNSVRIASREVTIPAVKENRIHELLVTNSAEYFPVDLVRYQLVHHIVERNTQENTYTLSVLAVPNEMIESYLALAEALGLQVEALDYMGNSVAQGMLYFLPNEEKVSVKIDEQSALLTIIRGNKIELQRNIPYGIRDAAEAVMVHPAFGEKRTFEPLIGNIRRILDYYISRNQGATCTEIWLLGIGAECEGLGELLASELNVKILPLRQLPKGFELAKNINATEFSLPEYTTCIAATIAPLNFHLNREAKKENLLRLLTKNELGYAPLVCAVCFLVAIGMVAYSVMSTGFLKMKNDDLQREIASMRAAQQTYETYQKTQTQYDDLKQMETFTETPNDTLPAFLAEMEEKMPAEISVYSMTAGVDGVSMNITVSSKAVASRVLSQLRNFETIERVDTPGITETKSDGRTIISFSVYCTYAEE